MFPQLTVLVKVSHRIRVICSSHIQITEDTYRMYKDHPEINFKTYYTHRKMDNRFKQALLQRGQKAVNKYTKDVQSRQSLQKCKVKPH